MGKLKNEIIILIVLILAASLLVFYNVYSVEMQKREDIRQAEEEARLEEERQRLAEEKWSEEAGKLAEYYPDYKAIAEEFIIESSQLQEELKGHIANVASLKEIASARLDLAVDYRDKFAALNTPAPLKTFSSYELEYIESDIQTIRDVLLYYESGSYSTYDDSDLKELYRKTVLLYSKAEEELTNVYSRYELDYLFE
jgi:hypothetical protein